MTLIANPAPSSHAVPRHSGAGSLWLARVSRTEVRHRNFGGDSRLDDLKRELAEILAECAAPDWDGEGAEPVTAAAAERTLEFLRALPATVPLPTLAPERDGCISVDWLPEQGRCVTVSIGPTSRLIYAWVDGADSGRGIETMRPGDIPARLQNEIRCLVACPA